MTRLDAKTLALSRLYPIGEEPVCCCGMTWSEHGYYDHNFVEMPKEEQTRRASARHQEELMERL